MSDICLKFVYVGTATMLASYLEVAAWMVTGATSEGGMEAHSFIPAVEHEVAHNPRRCICQQADHCAGTRISNRLRRQYLRSALRQDVGFYDTEATTGILLQGLNEDTNGIQNATGEKVHAALCTRSRSSAEVTCCEALQTLL